jgi:predicted transposase YdaD
MTQNKLPEKVLDWCKSNEWSEPFRQDGLYWGFASGSVLSTPLPLPQSHESYFLNQYAESIKTDPTCKFLAETFLMDFTTWLLGEPIALKPLELSALSSEHIEPDSSVLLDSGQEILHIEFHAEPDSWIPFKMIDIRLRIYHRFPEKQMRQVVVYLAPTDSDLVHQNIFETEMTRHQFEVIRIWEQPTLPFLESTGLLPLAVLTQTPDKAQTLKQVASRIDVIPDMWVQSDVAASAGILAGLTLERDSINQVLREEIMQQSVIYQERQC